MGTIVIYMFACLLCAHSLFLQAAETAFLYSQNYPINFNVKEPFFVKPINYDAYELALRENNEYFPGNRFFSPRKTGDLTDLRAKAENEYYSWFHILIRYVNGELAPCFNIAETIENVLKCGIGIDYFPGQKLELVFMGKEDASVVLYRNFNLNETSRWIMNLKDISK